MTDIFKGATSNSRLIELVDSTTGLPKTGIVYTDVTGSYVRTRSARVAITMATLASASAAFSSGGFILIDDTNQPGVYRVDIPDAAFVTGVDEVVVTIKATGCRTVSRSFDLVNINNQIAYVPNAAADAAGGLPISDAGGLDLDSKLANTNEVTTARMGALTDWIDGGRLDLILDIIAADTTTDIPALIATLQGFVDTEVAAIKAKTDNLPADPADASDIASAFSTVNTKLDTIDGIVDSILVDTNELQSDWVNGGRLDLILDARASQSSVDTIDGIVDSILIDTTEIGAAGAGLTAIPWNASWDTEVQSECADALTAYDPPTRAELTTDTNSVLTAVGDVPTNSELTTALASADDAVLSAVATVDTVVDAIKVITDQFVFTIAGQVDSNALSGGGGLDAAGVRAAVGLASANLDTQLSTIDTVVDAILVDTGTTLQAELDGIQADTEDIQSRIPAALISGRIDASVGAAAANTITASAFATDAVTEIQSGLATAASLATVAEYLDTEIAAILADTNELQTDWVNGGRLDLILDARSSQSSVDDLPTNSELTTALLPLATQAYIEASILTFVTEAY